MKAILSIILALGFVQVASAEQELVCEPKNDVRAIKTYRGGECLRYSTLRPTVCMEYQKGEPVYRQEDKAYYEVIAASDFHAESMINTRCRNVMQEFAHTERVGLYVSEFGDEGPWVEISPSTYCGELASNPNCRQ